MDGLDGDGVAVVDICVASLPCSGSVRPKVILKEPLRRWGMNSAFWAGEPKWMSMSKSGKFPTMLCSF